MRLQTGMVVRAVAGKEQDNFYLIVKMDTKYVWLSDGRHRTLQNPKRKNPKHVRPTKTIWNLDSMTDNSLHKKLRLFKEGNKFV